MIQCNNAQQYVTVMHINCSCKQHRLALAIRHAIIILVGICLAVIRDLIGLNAQYKIMDSFAK